MQDYVSPIDRLIEQFTERFTDFRSHQSDFDLVSNPLGFDVNAAPTCVQLELLSLQSDPLIKADFQCQVRNRDLLPFDRELPREKFPNIRRHAKRIFPLFGSTYLCEQTRVFFVIGVRKYEPLNAGVLTGGGGVFLFRYQ